MNPVLMICYGNLELTKRALASAMAQDIGNLEIYFVNNGSNDGMREWLNTLPLKGENWNLYIHHHDQNYSPIRIANSMYAKILGLLKRPYVLSIPNDVVLHPSTYRELLKWPRGLVCASDNGRNDLPDPLPAVEAVSECTPVAVGLLRRWFYDALIAKDGYYLDENYFHYASDCDLALRMAACGLRGLQISLPYWHFGSATHKLPEIHLESCRRADSDRAYFKRKWGFACDSLEYGQRPADINFKAEANQVLR